MRPDIKIDIGCGDNKREGYIGIDSVAGPGVDHVLDVTAERLPFEDASVSHVFTSHFMEHIASPNHVLSEIGRVCADHARIEIITPYAFSDDAFVYGHVTFFTELPWIHICVTHRDVYLSMIGGRWQLNGVNFVVPPARQEELLKRGFDLEFAIKYFKGVVAEMCLDIEFRRDLTVGAVQPLRSYSGDRFGERVPLLS